MRETESNIACLGAHAFTGLLRCLAPNDLTRMRTQFQAKKVSKGTLLMDVGDAGDIVYFPQGPLVSLRQDNGVEVALIGSEGFIGWPALVGVTGSPFRAVVCGRDGTILALRAELALAAIAASPRIGHLFHRFATMVGIQMAETLGASALLRVDMRVARWILLRHDRAGGDEILVQHEEVAENLGTRRASITDALHVIEGLGAVRCRRGRLLVRNRPALEDLASACYGKAEQLYRQSIGAFGKPATPTDTLQARQNRQLLITTDS